MKTTDFAEEICHFFTDYLVNDRGCSQRTIETYRYAFLQFIDYLRLEYNIKDTNITLNDINSGNVLGFLNWLETKKKVSIETRNHRLAAIKSFARFLKQERPEYIITAISIAAIHPKHFVQKEISYLKPDGIKLLMSLIPRNTKEGRRDFTIMTVLYTTAIRVSELIGIKGTDISLTYPKTLTVKGKGSKKRIIPIVKHLAKILESYLEENGCLHPTNINKCIFLNHSNNPFSRQGINYLIKKYASRARLIDPSLIPEDCSPHKIRHSCAMALLEDGVDLIIIRDLLGHSSVQTTEIYAKASSAKRRNAIESASKEIVPREEAQWEKNDSLRDWLIGLPNTKIM